MSEHGIATLPLQGKRVLVTRTREQAGKLSERLRSLGAIPVEFPTIRIVPPQDWTQLDAALRRLFSSGAERYDWLVFTSVNGVNISLERARTLGYEPETLRASSRASANVRIAAIGPATAAALRSYGLSADLVPDAYVAEGVIAALLADTQQRGGSLSGLRVLLARAAEARKILVTELQRAGTFVDEVAAYYTHTVASDDAQGREVLRLLREQQLDILTFTSSSTVRNFVAWLKSCEHASTDSPLTLVTQHARLASIGPITSRTAHELGLPVAIEAREFTIDGLVQAIVRSSLEGGAGGC